MDRAGLARGVIGVRLTFANEARWVVRVRRVHDQHALREVIRPCPRVDPPDRAADDPLVDARGVEVLR